MTKTIMIQGTASNVGKTLLTAGLCRIFRQDGYRVAPFKAQNMALNSFVTRDGLEMGRAQVMQAEACGLEPDARMNPILLKPTTDRSSQVIVNGRALGTMSAQEYHAAKAGLKREVKAAFDDLAAEHDIMVIEGAGSPAEINLRQQDLVNMGMALMVRSPVILVGDIDRGGVFASLAGTMLLLTEEERALVKGVIINKFRGDREILRPGLAMLEELIHVPVVGIVPHLDIKVDDEDSLTDRFIVQDAPALVDIAVIRLPRISNFTDFNPLEYMDGVSLRYIRSPKDLGTPDLIILPGSKNSISDLAWLRQSGLATAVVRHAANGLPILGVCGGLQILGQRIEDPSGVEAGGEATGLGLLPCSTRFGPEKRQVRTQGMLSTVGGIFTGLSGLAFKGYEIHMGDSDFTGNFLQSGNVYGTYLHGLFDSEEIRRTIIAALLAAKGLDFSSVTAFDMDVFKQEQYDILATALREALDMNVIYAMLEQGEQWIPS